MYFFFKAEDGIRDESVTGVQTCALPIDRKSTRLNSSHTLISYALLLGVQTSALPIRSEEHTSELQSHSPLDCRRVLLHATVLLVNFPSHLRFIHSFCFFFFFNDTATTEIYPLSLHDALPICGIYLAPHDQRVIQVDIRRLKL